MVGNRERDLRNLKQKNKYLRHNAGCDCEECEYLSAWIDEEIERLSKDCD